MNFFIDYNTIALISLTLWFVGSVGSFFHKKRTIELFATLIFALGILFYSLFIVNFWIEIDREPIRTLGETRMWYALFMPFLSLIIYIVWKKSFPNSFRFILSGILLFSSVMSLVFILINMAHPDTFDKTLMPALQSYWFVPHVIVYIFAYAILGISMLLAILGLILQKKEEYYTTILSLADRIVYLGFSFLTLGLLFGALWAKEAWGHYWTWDPKETWAFITWMFYLIYIHIRHYHQQKTSISLWILALAFVVLLICWFGVNYLSAAENSVHTYGTENVQ